MEAQIATARSINGMPTIKNQCQNEKLLIFPHVIKVPGSSYSKQSRSVILLKILFPQHEHKLIPAAGFQPGEG